MQLYTAFGYRGPGTARAVKDELVALLRAEGRTWGEVVKDAVERSAWREPVVEPTRDTVEGGKGQGEASVKLLVQEAEELKRLLDGLGERMGENVGSEEAVVVSPVV